MAKEAGKREGRLAAGGGVDSVGADDSVRPSPGAALQKGEDRVVLPYAG